MGLTIEDRLKYFVPARVYYPYKIAKEMRRREPELGLLSDLVPVGCTAVDAGANRGLYSYALAKLAGRVEAFEPNPMLAHFSRQKLGPKVRLHEMALAAREGQMNFYLPQTTPGTDSHLLGNLLNLHPTLTNIEFQVRAGTLDGFGFENVGFIKIDVEGFEEQVIEGAMKTIVRWHPNLLVELLVGWHESQAKIERICEMFNYEAFILVEGNWLDACQTLKKSSSLVKSNNVLFKPKR